MFAGFEIAVDDPLVVRRFKRLGDLFGDGQGFVDRDRSTGDPLREILALDELHHERGDATAFFEAVNAADVRVIQRRERLRFPLKAGDPLGVRDERFRQNLDRNVATQLRVARLVDLAHATCPKGRKDLVRAEADAGNEGQERLPGIIREPARARS